MVEASPILCGTVVLHLLMCTEIFAFKTLSKHDSSSTACHATAISSRYGNLIRCDTPFSPHTLTAMNPRDQHHVESRGGICVFSRNGVRVCRQCRRGHWRSIACPSHKREKRQVLRPGPTQAPLSPINNDINPLMETLMCDMFCTDAMKETRETAVTHPTYRMPAIVCPTVPSPIVTPPGATAIPVTWPVPQARSPTGAPLMSVQVSGLGGPGDLFPEGRHVITYAAMDTSTFTDTCSFNVDIHVVRCPIPLWPKNGQRSCDMGDMIYGSSCSFTCDNGYLMQGKARITCMYDGQYDFPPPTCKAHTCGALPVPANSVLYKCTDHNSYKSACALVCNWVSGYKASMPGLTTCINGNWTQPLPTCLDHLAPSFENCPMTSIVVQADKGRRSTVVTWPQPVAKDNSGQAVVHQVKGQPSGTRFNEGLTEIQYTAEDAEGNWANPCTFSIIVEVLECPMPRFKDQWMEAHCPTGYDHGSTCEISCRMGLPLEGSSSINCEIGNTLTPTAFWSWTGPNPSKCKERRCPDLTSPRNGALVCDTWAGGTLCQMQCNENYDVPRTVAATQHFVCTYSTGHWSPTSHVPDCTDLRRPTNMVLPSEMYYYTGACGTASTEQEIKNQFIQSLKMSSTWSQSCDNDRNCHAMNVLVDCGTLNRKRKRRSTGSHLSAVAALVTWDFSVNFDMGNMSVTDAINKHRDILKSLAAATRIDIQNGVYDLNVGGVLLNKDSFATGYSDFQCQSGQIPVYASASCSACPTGTYYSGGNGADCLPCPVATYQDEDGASTCKPCPNGTHTNTLGARSVMECKDLCPPGTYSPITMAPCSPCPHGQYQSTPGAEHCLACPPGTTTEFIHAFHESACIHYDVVMSGPTSVAMTRQLSGDLSDFTLITWVKGNAAGIETTLISLVHPVHGRAVSLGLETAGDGQAGGQGNSSSVLTFPIDTWTHMAMVWYQSKKELNIYVGAKLILSHSFPDAVVPLVKAGSTVVITTGADSEIQLQGLMLFPSGYTTSEVKVMASRCSAPSQGAILSMDDLPQSPGSGLLLILPSTCDAVDECDPTPCPGHRCINGRDRYTCICNQGYSGVNCTQPPDFCREHLCQSGGECITQTDGYSCVCPPNFTGFYCQTEMIAVDGGWGNWTEWTMCSATCGGGVQTRGRVCDSPPPEWEGTPCPGNNTEVKGCNQEPCPVCSASDLERGYGAWPKCTGEGGQMTCTVTCREGLMFVQQPPVYTCTNGLWTPNRNIIPCTRIDNPDRLELRFRGSYDGPGCVEADVSGQMTQQLTSKTSEVSCLVSYLCNMTAKVEGCPSDVRVKRSSRGQRVRVSVVLSVDLSTHRHSSRTDKWAALKGAINTLQTSVRDLKSKNFSAFSVSGPKGRYNINPADMKITSKVTCPSGSVPRKAFCARCPIGTRYSEGRCVLCSVGTYQGQVGEGTCHPCPRAHTTHFRGATNRQNCIPSESTEEEINNSTILRQISSSYIKPLSKEDSRPFQPYVNIPEPVTPDMLLSTTSTSTEAVPRINGFMNSNQNEPTQTESQTTSNSDILETDLLQDIIFASMDKMIPNVQQDNVQAVTLVTTVPPVHDSLSSNKQHQPPTLPEPKSSTVPTVPQHHDAAVTSQDSVSVAKTMVERGSEADSEDDSNMTTIIIAAVVTSCVVAVIAIIACNCIIIRRKLKSSRQEVQHQTWVQAFIHPPFTNAEQKSTKARHVSVS